MNAELSCREAIPEVALRAAPELSASQAEVVGSGMLDGSAILHVATSWGKTWIARVAIRKALERNRKAVYLCPLRAIAKELRVSWASEFDGATLGAYTGEQGQDELEASPAPADADIIIATPEKLDYFLRSWRTHLGWLAKVDLLVVDELHNLGAGMRGATLEGVIGRFRALSPFLRVLGLSATLGNPHQLGQWLGARVYESAERPVPLTWRIAPFKNQADKQSIVIDECRRVVGEGGQVIVFVQSRPRAESLAVALVEEGVGAMPHHAGLSRGSRAASEAQFRSRSLSVLVATPTLAQGVNLPARTVIVHDLSRWEGGGWAPLSTNEVWQLAGRAGHKGLDSSGEVILLAPKWDQTDARQYVRGKFEAILSQVEGLRRAEAEQIMVIYGSGLARTEKQATRVLSKMLMGHCLGERGALGHVGRASRAMIAAGMLVERDDGSIVATRLGRIAVRFQLSPETVAAWARLVDDQAIELHLFDFLLCVCGSIDFTARSRCEVDVLAQAQIALDAEPSAIKRLDRATRASYMSVRGRELVRAVRTAVMLRAWTRLGDIAEVADFVGALPHELDEARTECVRMLHALSALVTEMAKDPEALPGQRGSRVREQIVAVRAMVCAGLDDEQATLALVNGVGPVLARRLIAAGVGDVEDLALADAEQLAQSVSGLSAARAEKWIEEAEQHVRSGGAFRFREWEREARTTGAVGEEEKVGPLDYFRWRRASLLVLTEQGSDEWVVSGGSEPHIVSKSGRLMRCDCHDAAKGHLCKHAIAVRVALGDGDIPSFDSVFDARSGNVDGPLNLVHEWSVATC